MVGTEGRAAVAAMTVRQHAEGVTQTAADTTTHLQRAAGPRMGVATTIAEATVAGAFSCSHAVTYMSSMRKQALHFSMQLCLLHNCALCARLVSSDPQWRRVLGWRLRRRGLRARASLRRRS